MSRPLDELIVRHLDDGLTAAEAADLADRLRADPAARERFRLLCVQAIAIGEAAAANRRAEPVRRPWRTRLAVVIGVAGLAAAVAVAVTGRTPAEPVRLTRVSGDVRIRVGGTDRPADAGAALAPGAVVFTDGFGASATVRFPDGTSVVLTENTEAAVGGGGRPSVSVARGVVSADVPVRPAGDPFVLATPEARAVADAGSRLSVSRAADATEVGVSEGRVRVTDPAGDRLMDMGGGDVGSVDAHGEAHKYPDPLPPDAYAWNPRQPLPAGWELGRVADRAFAPVLWFDRYNRRDCWGIRSENRWVRGLFRVHPDSRFRVKYKVDRPGVGQLLVVVRLDPASPSNCQVLLAPLTFAPAADGGWRTDEFAVGDWEEELKPGRPRLAYPMPWVVSLVAFNTYEHDLGLRVAEFTAGRGRLPAAAD